MERIRDIRVSEKVFYRQVLDIYAASVDYDPKAEISIEFFKKMQNKIHYTVHSNTFISFLAFFYVKRGNFEHKKSRITNVREMSNLLKLNLKNTEK